jgi:formylglycine-generating enzyme
MLNFRLSTHFILIGSLMISGCSNQNSNLTQSDKAQPSQLNLGSIERCNTYSGLPDQWLKNETSGMVKLPAGEFNLGSNQGYPDEVNFGQKTRKVNAFWIDQTEVTVAQFQSFVDATHYVTDAEKQNQAAVFEPNLQNPKQWWALKAGYSWKFPNGKNSKPASANEPVRYVTKNDAEHYAIWLDRDLPTEIEWEYAAKAGDVKDTPLYQHPTDHAQKPKANYWQGEFPFENLKQDHFEGIAPVGCYTANAFGLYDSIGNVWEWTSSPYQGAHDNHMGDYQSLRKQHQSSANFVIKGGSFLCADNYCARFRNSSRHPQEFDLATTHVGFRTVKRITNN